MRILVYGAGAVGSALGGFLELAGHEVGLLGRPAHMEAVARDGLTISGILGDFRARPGVVDNPVEFDPELVIITVKSFDTKTAARELAPLGNGKRRFLGLQNGIGNGEILAESLPPETVFSGMIIIGFVVPAPGHVKITVYGGDMQVGRIGRPRDREIDELARVFQDIPIKVHAADHIESHLWSKLLYNASLNPLGAILGVNYGRLTEPAVLGMIRALLTEAFAIIRARSIPVPWSGADEYFEHLVNVQIPATSEHRPSMLADLEAGRRTEIDFINGAICRLGREIGHPTPVNETLTAQIKFLEQRALNRRQNT